ncbi:hypothetical protein [Nonomuraea sp. NPDC049480]|uniref:hypothetical protein n=1 Tax=Nonomuraea sp. NPDC049480 TaxID=3364353 RepID=UPI0037BDFCD5
MLIPVLNVHPASWTTPSTTQHCRSTSPKDDQLKIMTEGINGRLKGHHIDLGDPKNRLAQTLLAALMVAVANELILLAWRQVHAHREPPPEDTCASNAEDPDLEPPAASGRPPPGA